MKSRILKLLRESGDYISGQQLCEELGVSRTAVWKVMGKLKEEGYQIDSVPNRGYRLVASGDVFSAEEIGSLLTTEQMGRQLVFYEETGSTNTDCRRLMEEKPKSGILVVAANQNAGKGRRGRGWISPKDTSISFSLGLIPEFSPQKASMLTLVMALAVQKAISRLTGLKTLIKWPNDIVVNGKKICGILTEMNMEMDYISSVIIGVGINVSQREFPGELTDRATSLLLETKQEQRLQRSVITAECINQFEQEYKRFLETEDLSGMKEEYEAVLTGLNSEVCVLDPKGEYKGISRGITTSGELLVERKDGSVTCVYAGEVSVRGLYGYVN